MTNLLRRRRFLRWGWRCVGFGKTHWQPRRAHPETADPHSWWGKDWRHAQHLHIHTKSGNAFITGANFLFCRVKTSPFRSIRNWWRIICAGRTVAPPLRHQNHWCASLLCWMEDGDARGRKKERKKGSTLHTRGSGLLNARLNLNSEHVKAFRGFARESKGERPRDGRRRGKKWTRPKTDGESRWHMRGKIMNVKVRLQWEWNICHMCAGCDNILRNICKQLVAQNWDTEYMRRAHASEFYHIRLCLHKKTKSKRSRSLSLFSPSVFFMFVVSCVAKHSRRDRELQILLVQTPPLWPTTLGCMKCWSLGLCSLLAYQL